MSVSVAMETLLYKSGSVEMQRSEGGEREVGGEREENVVGEERKNAEEMR